MSASFSWRKKGSRGERGYLGRGLYGTVDIWVGYIIHTIILFWPNVGNLMMHRCSKFRKKIFTIVKVIQRNVVFRKYFFYFLKMTFKFRNFKVFKKIFYWHHQKALSIYFRTVFFFSSFFYCYTSQLKHL